MKLLSAFLGLTLANYAFQSSLGDGANYALAFDRTYFQGIALLAVGLVEKVLK